MKISWRDAIWVWPLTFFLVIGISEVSNHVSFISSFLCDPSGIGAILFGTIVGIISGIGFRRGLRLFKDL